MTYIFKTSFTGVLILLQLISFLCFGNLSTLNKLLAAANTLNPTVYILKPSDSKVKPATIYLKAKGFHIKTVVIDAGHGGHDPGAAGCCNKEKTITLSIAKKLRDAIHVKYPGIKIILTRDKDVFVELDERAHIAIRNKANLFISIHCNANSNPDARGSETYAIGLHANKENLEVAERENSAILLEKDYKIRYQGFDPKRPESYIIFSMMQGHMIKRSLKLAGDIQSKLGASFGRGVKQAGFLVLRKTTMPAVLVETGFITNSVEEKRLASAFGQTLIAERIFKGFEKYKEAVE